MKVFNTEYERRTLEPLVGARRQLGGVDLITFGDGHARNTRGLDIRTGSGLRFQVLPDRGFDIGFAEFAGTGLTWLPPKGLAGPWFYEGDHDDFAWLRIGLGGLFNTAGLVSMGTPQTVSTAQYGFTQRLAARYGTHDRIAITPAERFNYGERWDGDRLVLWAEGTVRQDIAYGENLTLSRTYEVEAGTSTVTIRDEVCNEGFFPTPHQILYHFNLGFPFLRWPGQVIASPDGPVGDLSFSTASGAVRSPDRWQHITEPERNFTHEGFTLPFDPDGEEVITVAVATGTDEDRLAVFLRTRRAQLPCYVLWRMMRQGLYAYGLEPCNSPFGTTDELLEQGWPLTLEPGERRIYELEFGVVAGHDAVEALAEKHHRPSRRKDHHDTMSTRFDAYLQTLGKVPPAIDAMNRADPQVLDGYLTMREAVMAQHEDGLPFKYKELVFIILDLLAGNIDGAKLHLAAGLNAGLTKTELTEALFQTMLLHGLKTWGLGGYQLVDFAESYQPSPKPDSASAG